MKNTKRKLIPNNLRRCRKVRGLTQKQVAEIMQLKSAAMISRWEAGSCIPTTHSLFGLAAVYRTTTEALYWEFAQQRRQEMTGREELLRDKSNQK